MDVHRLRLRTRGPGLFLALTLALGATPSSTLGQTVFVEDEQKEALEDWKKALEKAGEVTKDFAESDFAGDSADALTKGSEYFEFAAKSVGQGLEVLAAATKIVEFQATVDCLGAARDCVNESEIDCRKSFAYGSSRLFTMGSDLTDKAGWGSVVGVTLKYYGYFMRKAGRFFIEFERIAGDCRGHVEECRSFCQADPEANKAICMAIGEGALIQQCQFLQEEFDSEEEEDDSASGAAIAAAPTREVLCDDEEDVDCLSRRALARIDKEARYLADRGWTGERIQSTKSDIAGAYSLIKTRKETYEDLGLQRWFTAEGKQKSGELSQSICAAQKALEAASLQTMITALLEEKSALQRVSTCPEHTPSFTLRTD